MKNYSCPKCGAGVPLDDINVGADVALCRACGERFHVAELIGEMDESEAARMLSGPAPKHLEVIRMPDAIDGRMELRYRKINPIVLFLIPFTLFWSGGSLGGIYGSQLHRHAFDWRASLFGLPFLIGTIVLVCAILSMLFAKRRLALKYGHGEYSAKVFGIGRTVRFDLNHSTELKVDESHVRRGVASTVIAIKNQGDIQRICACWDEESLSYAVATLNRYRCS